MATIVDPVVKVNSTGHTPTYVAVASNADTHQVQNNGRMFLHFKKTGAGNAIVTVQTPRTIDGNAIAEKTLTVVATTGDEMIGTFNPSVYNQLGQHYLQWTVDDVVGLTVAALQIGD
jgi:hypothetical protein